MGQLSPGDVTEAIQRHLHAACELIERLLHRIRQPQMLLVIDEKQPIISANEPERLDLFAKLRTQLSECSCLPVLVGSSRSGGGRTSAPCSRQVGQVVVLRSYDWRAPEARTEFRNLCARIDHDLAPFRRACCAEVENPSRLFEACAEKIAQLERLLVEARRLVNGSLDGRP